MSKRQITIRRATYLRGPNIWTYRPVIEALVDIGEFEDLPSSKLPGFNERLKAWLPGMFEHRCGVGERGGFFLRLDEGTWMGHIMEHVAIELQNLAGMKVGFGKTRSTSERGVYKMVVRARNEHVARAAIYAACDILHAAVDDRPYDIAASVAKLHDLVDDHYMGPSTACIVEGATERRIPAIRLNDGNLIQLGYGARQRRIWTAETDRTSAIAEGIAGDKDLTKRLIAACGVPVPEGQIVESAEEAWTAAEDIGLPVVVKPVDGNHGRGVSIELTTREQIMDAYAFAERHGSEVMVERCIKGNEHRLLVVGGQVVAAARGETAWVKGDGKSTVAELVDMQINSDPRRGTTEAHPLNRISIYDDTAIANELARQGLAADSVPAADRMVLIQRNGNVAFEVTDKVCDDVAEMAALAARIVGLDIAGVDLVAEDVSRPLAAQGGAIVEVNAGPGLLMHLKPAEGEPRPVGRAIIDHLFPGEDSGRIPIVGITGSEHGSVIARLVAWLLHLSGLHVGVACGDGLYLDRRCVEAGDRATWDAGERVLMNRMVEAAVFENGAEVILGQGLAYDRCHIGIVTDMGGLDKLTEYDIRDRNQLYSVVRTQIDVVMPDGAAVLNADDEEVASLAELSDGGVILYGMDPNLPALAAHRAEGGRAVTVLCGAVVLQEGEQSVRVVDIARLPREKGEPLLPAAALLPAIAAAWAMNIDSGGIEIAVESFAAHLQGPVTTTAKPASKNTATGNQA